MQSVSLYKRLALISMRSQMQYKVSFLVTTLAHGLTTAGSILAVWMLFARFQSIGSWTFPEVALLYGIVHIGFGLAEGFGRGFDKFGNMVKAGDFDRLLLRPCSSLVQVAGSDVQLLRLGRVVQGFCVLIYAILALNLYAHPLALLEIAFCVVGAAALFFSLLIIQASICFWSTESLELMNILTFGGLEAGQYPLSIYQSWFRNLLTFIVPLACVAYIPVSALLNRENPEYLLPFWLSWGAPFFGVLFLLLAMAFWSYGVKRYTSTGS